MTKRYTDVYKFIESCILDPDGPWQPQNVSRQEFSEEALTEEREDQVDQWTSKQEENEGVEQPHSSTQMSFPKIEALELKAEEDPLTHCEGHMWGD